MFFFLSLVSIWPVDCQVKGYPMKILLRINFQGQVVSGWEMLCNKAKMEYELMVLTLNFTFLEVRIN